MSHADMRTCERAHTKASQIARQDFWPHRGTAWTAVSCKPITWRCWACLKLQLLCTRLRLGVVKPRSDVNSWLLALQMCALAPQKSGTVYGRARKGCCLIPVLTSAHPLSRSGILKLSNEFFCVKSGFAGLLVQQSPEKMRA